MTAISSSDVLSKKLGTFGKRRLVFFSIIVTIGIGVQYLFLQLVH